MNNCKLKIEDIINKYTKHGWYKLTNLFYKQKYGKEKNIKLKVNESLLKLLGNIRLYIIENTFNCVNKNKDTYYVAYGSTNVTSDYDLTIIGKNASQVMYDMFHSFLKKYGNTLPYTYDSNVYTDGLYLSKDINSNIKQVRKLDDKLSILLPYDNTNYKYSISFACIKLLDIKINKKLYPKLQKFLNLADEYLINLTEDYNKMLKIIKKKYKNKSFNKKTLNTITDVELNYKNSKKIYKILYENSNPKNIIKYQTTASYFANEAYYLCSTIAVIVLEIQANKKVKLNKYDYIGALIENLGDMNIHICEEIKNSSKPFNMILLKYSKYIYRIYYCLSKISNNSNIKNITKKINNEIISARKTGNINNIDFSLLNYNNETPKKYISKFNNIMLNYLEKYLTL
jgi:hypothetical protein